MSSTDSFSPKTFPTSSLVSSPSIVTPVLPVSHLFRIVRASESQQATVEQSLIGLRPSYSLLRETQPVSFFFLSSLKQLSSRRASCVTALPLTSPFLVRKLCSFIRVYVFMTRACRSALVQRLGTVGFRDFGWPAEIFDTWIVARWSCRFLIFSSSNERWSGIYGVNGRR